MWLDCFNEAPANSPGNFRSGCASAAAPPGFNEAPANSPGNMTRAIWSMVPSSGFNEAPANSPGNDGAVPLASPAFDIASMRPRRIRRGTPRSRTSLTTRRRCFNEAPANSPGNGGGEQLPRGWAGSRFNEAPANSPGNAPERKVSASTRAAASMRPRRIRRGTVAAYGKPRAFQYSLQ